MCALENEQIQSHSITQLLSGITALVLACALLGTLKVSQDSIQVKKRTCAV